MVHVAESVVGRRYAGWFIRNTEGAERAYDALRAAPLPAAKKDLAAAAAVPAPAAAAPKAVSFAKVGA